MFQAPKRARLFLDLSALLLALAFERGLFTDSLDKVLNGNDLFLQVNPIVAEQALFIRCRHAGALLPGYPMISVALNRKLQELCRRVGLLEHNTFYAFRRAAASETVDAHGIETAQALLGLNPSEKATLVNYDPVGMGRDDLAALRIQGEALTTSEIEKFFRQSYLALEKMEEFTEHNELESDLQDIFVEIHEMLREHQLVKDQDFRAQGDSIMRYTKLLGTSAIENETRAGKLSRRIEEYLVYRKSRRRDMGTAIQKRILEDMETEHHRLLKFSRQTSEAGLSPEQEDGSFGDEEAVNEEVLFKTAAETEAWKTLGKDDVIVVLDDSVPAEPSKDRIAFLRNFIAKEDSEIKSSGLFCTYCRADSTTKQGQQSKIHGLSKLDAHQKCKDHSQREQLQRAFKNNLQHATNGKVACPICMTLFKNHSTFLKHVKEDHASQL